MKQSEIAAVRTSFALSQVEVSAKAGITQVSLSLIETGKIHARPRTLAAIDAAISALVHQRIARDQRLLRNYSGARAELSLQEA